MGNEKETHERPAAPVYQESPPPGEPEPQPQPEPPPQPSSIQAELDIASDLM